MLTIAPSVWYAATAAKPAWAGRLHPWATSIQRLISQTRTDRRSNRQRSVCRFASSRKPALWGCPARLGLLDFLVFPPQRLGIPLLNCPGTGHTGQRQQADRARSHTKLIPGRQAGEPAQPASTPLPHLKLVRRKAPRRSSICSASLALSPKPGTPKNAQRISSTPTPANRQASSMPQRIRLTTSFMPICISWVVSVRTWGAFSRPSSTSWTLDAPPAQLVVRTLSFRQALWHSGISHRPRQCGP